MLEPSGRKYGVSLHSFSARADWVPVIRKSDVCPGDLVILRTKNSCYELRALGDDAFEVSGGWFDRKGRPGTLLAVRGCSMGGSMLKIDVIAACGLCTEFANSLVTTPVKSFVVLRRGWSN
jgi:hypothetical protein